MAYTRIGWLMRLTALFVARFFIGSVLNAQTPPSPPAPAPLTKIYTFQGVTFRYPANWIIRQKPGTITVAPPVALDQGTNGSFVTHGLFMGVYDGADSLDAAATQVLQTMAKNSPHVQTSQSSLTHIGNPAWAACGNTLDTNPPYVGTETGTVCAYRVGSHNVVMVGFSPSRDWEQYRQTLAAIAGSMYSDLNAGVPPTASQSPPLPVIPPRPQLTGDCESGHWIKSVGGDGKVITLEDGSMWEVDDVDTVDTAIWLPVSNIVICGSRMINLDDKENAEVSPITPSSVGGTRNTIQAAINDEDFVIGGSVFKAKTYCFGIEKGDRITFIKGSPNGVCVSGTFLDMRNNKLCEVWCP